jgi:hypothetical protein
MKQLSLYIISILTSFSLLAGSPLTTESVTITVNGNKNLQVTLDGNNYNLNNSTIAGSRTTISLINLETGQHSLRITRTDQNTNKSDIISIQFNLRYTFEMQIKVNGNGSLELIETGNGEDGYNQVPMTATNFSTLLRNVKAQRNPNQKRTMLSNAFNKTDNYFTTYQVAQLLQQITAESYRVQLAKLSYHTITDRSNFYELYDLIKSQAGKEEVMAYVNDFYVGDNSFVAMPDNDFNTLYQGIKNQWPVSTQMNSLTNTFNAANNHFSTYQAGQLIQLVSTESNRLQLAKLSYRTITDPSNFQQIYNLLNSQASRNELAAYVNDNSNTGTNANNAMSDLNFNNLYSTIQQQWPLNTQMNSLTNAFNDNYFTTNQAVQLIQIVLAENNRLQLAKLSYRSITDRNNFNQVYSLLSNEASKNELATYISNNYGTVYNPHVAMSDADFNTVYQDVRGKYLPFEKMNTLTSVFNTTTNYFTSSQAKQLVQLVTLESNRLQLAKLSYRTVTDRGNFSQLYELLSNDASKTELDNYVKAYKD